VGSTQNIHNDIQFPVDDTKENNRPHVFLNMVLSADGRTSVEGKASGLGTDVDRSVMRNLRSRADAVMVGGGTVRAERLSISLDAEDARPVPRAVIMTNTGDLPLESNLVRDHRQDVLVLLSDSAEKGVESRLGRLAEIRRVPATAESGAIDVEKALEIMKSEYGIKVLLCEGGPTLIGALISANLVDELFVTIAPVLVGANTPEEPGTFLNHRQGDPIPLRLISSHAVGNELFLRYSIEARR
jgi:2,5-diamino-6-(ribosylamino)-4(3H)-pyrimidinone 5'-phosphate reductase